MLEWAPLLLFGFVLCMLLLGFPVAFTLGGSSLLFAGVLASLGHFDLSILGALPERIFGIMNNQTLMAIPLFIFMGMVLERSKISEDLLAGMSGLFGKIPGGLGISVCLVGGLLAASTGIVGATVVSMGLISLPSMLKQKYDPRVAAGLICASGTLGQIIPPSIVLIIMADVMGAAFQQSQLQAGIFSVQSLSVADLFVGALVPGILLMFSYMFYIFLVSLFKPHLVPRSTSLAQNSDTMSTEPKIAGSLQFVLLLGKKLLPSLSLIVGVLGSILYGVATPTEAASVGCIGALLLARMKGCLSFTQLKEVLAATVTVNSMIFTILIGANIFSLVFRGIEGDEWVRTLLTQIEGGVWTSFFIVMLAMFLMGFFLDFFEISFVVIPVVGPVLLSMGLNPIWLGVMMALNLQTSFLTPPFGFSLFYLKGVSPPEVKTSHIYRGVIPFIIIQILVMTLLWVWPSLIIGVEAMSL